MAGFGAVMITLSLGLLVFSIVMTTKVLSRAYKAWRLQGKAFDEAERHYGIK